MSPKPSNAMTLGKATTLLFVLISLSLLTHTAFADEKTHYAAARELVDITYDEQTMYESAKRAALPGLKDRYENNPKTKKYSSVLIGLIMEVMDAHFHDPETQNKVKVALAKTYVEEFTELELRESIRYYKTPIGQKILRRLPAVMQKGWERGAEIGSQVSSSPKYMQMLKEKLNALQDKGVLPMEFK